jgi:hypothetical protein
MANVLTSNPIRVDTVMTSSYKASVAAVLGKLFTTRVVKVRFLRPVNVGDTALIIDPQDGTELIRLVCQTAGVDVVEDFTSNPRIWTDFSVVQLDSGRLYIYTT